MKNRLDTEKPLIDEAVKLLHKIQKENTNKPWPHSENTAYHLGREGRPNDIRNLIRSCDKTLPNLTDDQARRIMMQFLEEHEANKLTS